MARRDDNARNHPTSLATPSERDWRRQRNLLLVTLIEVNQESTNMLGMLIRNLLLCWTSFRFVAETFYALDISIYLSLSLSPFLRNVSNNTFNFLSPRFAEGRKNFRLTTKKRSTKVNRRKLFHSLPLAAYKKVRVLFFCFAVISIAGIIYCFLQRSTKSFRVETYFINFAALACCWWNRKEKGGKKSFNEWNCRNLEMST